MKQFVSLLLFGSLPLCAQAAALPNLTPNPGVESLGVYIKTVNVAANDCAVTDGLITPGKHKILIFAAGIYSIGDADLDLSSAAGFIASACTGQMLYPIFRFELLDANNSTVAGPKDYAMCVADFSVIPGWPKKPSDGFTCSHQGITSGWRAFSMYNSLRGPFLLLDGIPAGTYTVRQTVNPDQTITESNYADNTYQFTVRVK